MRTATVGVMVLCLASTLVGSAAEPPPAAKPAPAPAPPAPTTAAPATGPATAPGAAHPPAGASEAAPLPERIDPTEKVHSDAEVTFPVDI